MKILEVNSLFTGYGKSEILHGVSVYLEKEEAITIIGPNGAGKSTLVKAIMGYLPIFKGEVYWKGDKITHLKPHESVRENLEMGGFIEGKEAIKEGIEKAFQLFPFLAERLNQKAGTLSGGQRQMLAMARALMTAPELLMLDEPSAGLSPKVSEEVFATISDIHSKLGRAIIMIEQDAYQSLRISDRGYVLVMGQNEFEDRADRILSNEKIREAYLGG
jgi:ABC-type branched-subunit amino acid transport system ATPase component